MKLGAVRGAVKWKIYDASPYWEKIVCNLDCTAFRFGMVNQTQGAITVYRISIGATGATLDEVYSKLHESVQRLAPATLPVPKTEAKTITASQMLKIERENAAAPSLPDPLIEKLVENLSETVKPFVADDTMDEFERKNLASQAEGKAREEGEKKSKRGRKPKEDLNGAKETAQVLSFPPAASSTPAPLTFAPPPVPASAVQAEVPAFAQPAAPIVFAQRAEVAAPVAQVTFPSNQVGANPMVPSVGPTIVQANPVYADPIVIPNTQKPAHSFATFKANFNLVVVGLVNEKKINREYIQQVCEFYKVDVISKVANDDAKCQGFFKVLVEAGFITEMT